MGNTAVSSVFSPVSPITQAYVDTHIYPFCSVTPNDPKRTKQQHHADAKDALSDGTIINGIKGPSWLMTLSCYNIIAPLITCIVYYWESLKHCCLFGSTRSILGISFTLEEVHQQLTNIWKKYSHHHA